MAGYHEAYAIRRVGQAAVVNIDGQYAIYTSMMVAAHNLGVLAKAHLGVEYTITPFKMRLPWAN